MAGKWKIELDQGATFSLDVTVKENGVVKDLTNYLGRGQFRKAMKQTTATEDFTVTIPAPKTQGVVQISLTAAETTALECGDSKDSPESQYLYDIEIYTAGDATVLRILEGALTVNPNVTR